MAYYGRSVKKALLSLFPDIGLDGTKLNMPRWNDAANRKKFFEDYAKANGFDPLDPINWYSRPLSAIKLVKGASEVIAHHGHSVRKALVSLFPNIGLQ